MKKTNISIILPVDQLILIRDVMGGTAFTAFSEAIERSDNLGKWDKDLDKSWGVFLSTVRRLDKKVSSFKYVKLV
jgi:hypothetical protein